MGATINISVYISLSLCIRAAKALASLHICTGSSEPPLLADAISSNILCTRSNAECVEANVLHLVICRSNSYNMVCPPVRPPLRGDNP